MKNRLLSLIVILAMVLGMLPGFALAANTDFAGGSGTQVDPYLISDKYQLDNVRNYLDKCFRLTNDIEFKNGERFMPIGDTVNPFEGTFDGGGYKIKNLQINISADGDVYAGLFGYSEGEIKNLGMVGGNITASSTGGNVYAGAIAGYASRSITNCYNTGKITANGDYEVYIGGIVGLALVTNYYEVTLKDCYNSGSLYGNTTEASYEYYCYSGGICGAADTYIDYFYTKELLIDNCYNTGTINSYIVGEAGGICGGNRQSDILYITIKNCYNKGDVSIRFGNACGIIGSDAYTISNCYNEGYILTEGVTCGIAVSAYDGIYDCYNAGFIEGGGRGGSASGIAYENYVSIRNCYNKGVIYAGGDATGITISNYGDISNCYNLEEISGAFAVGITGENTGTINECYNTGKIDASNSYDWANASGIANINSGTIKNCHNTGEISSWAARPDSEVYAGGITGENEGTIQNCHNAGNVTASVESYTDYDNLSSAYAGGIVGEFSNGTVEYCYNTGKITSKTNSSYLNVSLDAGGIAGKAGDISEYDEIIIIDKCYNTGAVTGDCAGGISGDNFNVITSNCYNAGTVTAVYVGGISGMNISGEIEYCYNIGRIIPATHLSDYQYAGGISGYNWNEIINNCYYINNVKAGIGDGENLSVATKCTSAQMEKSETFAGFDFESVWTMDADTLYPFPTLIGLPMDNFTDVPKNAWYKTFVDYAAEHGIFAGKGEGRFEPDANITRAEFVQVLANITGVDLAPYRANENFGDVKTTDWYSGAVNWAFENGIVSGTGYGCFSPNAKITREQMCVMLVNYVENYQDLSLDETVAVSTFADDNKISGWAKNAVYKCAKAGLVSGVGNGKFDPNSSASRAQGATIFTNFHKAYMK